MIDNFYKMDENKLLSFLERYKNIKIRKEMKGKVSESDIQNMIKKLRNLVSN